MTLADYDPSFSNCYVSTREPPRSPRLLKPLTEFGLS